MIHPGRPLVGFHRGKRRFQRGDGVELVDQAIPFASCDPLFEGRQHPLRPDRRFRLRPFRACVSSTFTRGLLQRDCHRCLSVRSRHRVSTFLHPFTPPALPGFIATMGAVTPVRCWWLFYHWHTEPCCRTGLSASLALPSKLSVSNHLAAPNDRFGTDPQRRRLPACAGLGFALPPEARQTARPNRVRTPTDCFFASGCSPPHLMMTQLPSASGLVGRPRTDLHPPDKARLRTHGGRPSPAMTQKARATSPRVNLQCGWY